MSSLPLVIVNPSSAGGLTGDSWPGMASDLATHFGAFSCAFTGKLGDARLIAAREAKSGRRFIIACGGDGTISEVANGILESGNDVELGVLPSGTGGDFRRTLGISTHPATAARSLRTGRARLIDVGRVSYLNHDGLEESRYFLGVASCGMSSEVIRRVKDGKSRWSPALRSSWLGGRLPFGLATVRTTLSFTNAALRVRIDDRPERHLTVRNLCVSTARYFGGGMKIAPEAKLNDGRLDIVAIGDLNSLEVLANAHRLYTGKHLGVRQVHHTLAKRITARPAQEEEKVPIEADGELPGRLPATFEILPRALRVRCP